MPAGGKDLEASLASRQFDGRQSWTSGRASACDFMLLSGPSSGMQLTLHVWYAAYNEGKGVLHASRWDSQSRCCWHVPHWLVPACEPGSLQQKAPTAAAATARPWCSAFQVAFVCECNLHPCPMSVCVW